MYKLLLVIITCIILFYLKKKYDNRIFTKHNIVKYNNIINSHTLEYFKDYNFKSGTLGNVITDIHEYGVNNLKVVNKYKQKLSDFMDSLNDDRVIKQAIVVLDDNDYFRDLLILIKKDLSKYYDVDDLHTFKLRISKNPWKYPAHFDCVDGNLLQLFNYREVHTLKLKNLDDFNNLDKYDVSYIKRYDDTKTTILNPGDLVKLPTGLIHAVRGYGANYDSTNYIKDVSIALSFFNGGKCYQCDDIFKTKFNYRVNELSYGYK